VTIALERKIVPMRREISLKTSNFWQVLLSFFGFLATAGRRVSRRNKEIRFEKTLDETTANSLSVFVGRDLPYLISFLLFAFSLDMVSSSPFVFNP